MKTTAMSFGKFLSGLALTVSLLGCQSLGLAPAQSLDERLAYSYSQVTAIRTSTAQALTTGTLSVLAAQTVLARTDAIQAGLEAAKVAESAGDTSTALGKLQAVTAALTSMSEFLTSQGVGK